MSLLDTFRERRPFPGQDPWIVPFEDGLLLVQSAGGDRRIVVKQFQDLDRMDRNRETTIWEPSDAGGHARQLWAPELHPIGDRWYVYFAASDGRSANHRTYALVADHPLGPYVELGPVGDRRHDVWAIDLTVFRQGGRLYAVWSGWEGPHDRFPQNLYIAEMANPWTISGERRCLSRPQHDWEKSVAPVNEGPEALRSPSGDRLFLLYSADASWTQAYKMGLLEWTGGDVAEPSSWRKQPSPFFTGGGHGCVVDTAGGPRLVYHRKVTGEPGWGDREIRTAALWWGADGAPAVASADGPAGVGGRRGPEAGQPGLHHGWDGPPKTLPEPARR